MNTEISAASTCGQRRSVCRPLRGHQAHLLTPRRAIRASRAGHAARGLPGPRRGSCACGSTWRRERVAELDLAVVAIGAGRAGCGARSTRRSRWSRSGPGGRAGHTARASRLVVAICVGIGTVQLRHIRWWWHASMHRVRLGDAGLRVPVSVGCEIAVLRRERSTSAMEPWLLRPACSQRLRICFTSPATSLRYATSQQAVAVPHLPHVGYVSSTGEECPAVATSGVSR